jgi:hypothetical protein
MHKGNYPQHDFESLLLQGANHAFWIGEFVLPKLPLSIILLPVIINHQDARADICFP